MKQCSHVILFKDFVVPSYPYRVDVNNNRQKIYKIVIGDLLVNCCQYATIWVKQQ